MPKFYVDCGPQSLVVLAESAEQAALRFIDEVMAVHVWIYDDSALTENQRRDHLVLEALMHLDAEIQVSERGLGRCEAGTFEVPDLLESWHQLMTAVSRLFSAAGLDADRGLPAEAAAIFNPLLPR